MVLRQKSWLSRRRLLAVALLCVMLYGSGMLAQTSGILRQETGQTQVGNPTAVVSIEGQVVDALTSEPIRQVALTLTIVETAAQMEVRRDRPPRTRTTTDAAGSFAFGNLPPGRYQLQGDKTGYVPAVYSTQPGQIRTLRDGLDLTQSGIIAPLDIVISSEGGMIQGVVMEGDAPRAGAYLTLFPETLTSGDQRLRRGANSEGSGQFVIRNVAPGNYRLFAWEQRFSFRELEERDLQPYQSSGVRVRVEENALERVEVPIIARP